MEVSWTLDDYDQVKQYNIYAGYADGSERFVGGAYADNYYIANLEDRDNIVSLKLKAVGKDCLLYTARWHKNLHGRHL